MAKRSPRSFKKKAGSFFSFYDILAQCLLHRKTALFSSNSRNGRAVVLCSVSGWFPGKYSRRAAPKSPLILRAGQTMPCDFVPCAICPQIRNEAQNLKNSTIAEKAFCQTGAKIRCTFCTSENPGKSKAHFAPLKRITKGNAPGMDMWYNGDGGKSRPQGRSRKPWNRG